MRVLILLAIAAVPARAQTSTPDPADQIAAAVLPLPQALRAGAGVGGYDAAGRPVMLRESRNGMVCTGDHPGDAVFDARCYDRAFRAVMDRRRQLVSEDSVQGPARFEAEVKAGKLAMPASPTAGYRMFGPIAAYDPRTRTFTSAIERWQSVHLPYRTASELRVAEEQEGTMPFVMSSGTWWSHVMIKHTPPKAAPLDQPGRLGTITFPTSGSPGAQGDFIRGVLYLHSFEYDEAAEEFRKAQQKDPGFVMAYWGEAMTHTHPIWNEQDLPAARAALTRLGPTPAARAARASTPRERAWLEAVEILYGEGSKPRRDTLYQAAMARVAADYPDDEATTFHALAIMGLSQAVRNVDAYMRAGALALPVFQRNPDHPGAAHYVIHAFDDPTHAILGLDAARAYSVIAPGAAHAQHMTTHIFLALGMWPEVISQNIIASGPDRSQWQPGHYTYWLHYGLLQAGRVDEAAALLDTLKTHAGPSSSVGRRATLALSRAHQVITGERWTDPTLAWTLDLDGAWPTARAADGFARGFAAIKRGDLAQATAIATATRALPGGTGLASVPVLIARELEASLARARGDKVEAERMLRAVIGEAGALPAEFGPPDFVKPPLELLGEWLREDGRADEAHSALEAAAAITPGRLLLRPGAR